MFYDSCQQLPCTEDSFQLAAFTPFLEDIEELKCALVPLECSPSTDLVSAVDENSNNKELQQEHEQPSTPTYTNLQSPTDTFNP